VRRDTANNRHRFSAPKNMRKFVERRAYCSGPICTLSERTLNSGTAYKDVLEALVAACTIFLLAICGLVTVNLKDRRNTTD